MSRQSRRGVLVTLFPPNLRGASAPLIFLGHDDPGREACHAAAGDGDCGFFLAVGVVDGWAVVLMPPLRSTSLAAADYDEEGKELTITFHNGQSYSYYDVPPEVYRQLLLSASPGSFYNSSIKGIYG